MLGLPAPQMSKPSMRAFLGITTLCHAAGALAYMSLQPRGFDVLSLAFFEHELLGPIVLILALLLGFATLKRRENLAAAVTAVLAGFWFVVAGFGLFTGTTFYARLLALPFAGAFLLFAIAYKVRRSVIAHATPLLAGALLGGAFWASALAPRASTFPSTNRPKSESGSTPNAEPTLEEGGINVRIEETSILVDAGGYRAEIVPSFDYEAVADSCGFTVLDYRWARLPPYRAGRKGDKIAFAEESADFQTSGVVEIEGASTVRINVSTTVQSELCAHLGSVVAIKLSRLGGSMESPDEPPRADASVNGIPWPTASSNEPFHFVAFQHGTLGFFRASRDEKGPFTSLGDIDEPVITASGFRVRVPSWKAQASREPSPTAGWGISQGAIEHVGDWFFWGIASTSIGRGWHTVRTAPGTYETTIIIEKL